MTVFISDKDTAVIYNFAACWYWETGKERQEFQVVSRKVEEHYIQLLHEPITLDGLLAFRR